jgi:twitching motility two-component system response regulator PilG
MAEGAEEADALIVDLDDDQTRAAAAAPDGHEDKPTVFVTANDSKLPAGKLVLKRPIIASRLLALIDQVCAAGHQPRAPVQMAPNGAGSSNQAEEGAVSGGRQAVLVVDDSPTVQKHLDAVLRDLGVEVVCASSGEAALDCLMHRTFDLILLDVVLPGADGYQVCKAIKNHLEKKHMPVVMLTSKSSPFDRIRGALAGCDAYLVKPVGRAQFLTIAHRHLERAAQRAVAPSSTLVARHASAPA